MRYRWSTRINGAYTVLGTAKTVVILPRMLPADSLSIVEFEVQSVPRPQVFAATVNVTTISSPVIAVIAGGTQLLFSLQLR